jgi:hypothetical protein
MESDQIDSLVRLWRRRRLLWNLYRFRKPLAFAAGLGIGCLVGCCVATRRGNVS